MCQTIPEGVTKRPPEEHDTLKEEFLEGSGVQDGLHPHREKNLGGEFFPGGEFRKKEERGEGYRKTKRGFLRDREYALEQ